MKRSKTVTVGELLDEFFQRPYIAAKVAEGRLRDTWREIVGPEPFPIPVHIPGYIDHLTSSFPQSSCELEGKALSWAPQHTRKRPPLQWGGDTSIIPPAIPLFNGWPEIYTESILQKPIDRRRDPRPPQEFGEAKFLRASLCDAL